MSYSEDTGDWELSFTAGKRYKLLPGKGFGIAQCVHYLMLHKILLRGLKEHLWFTVSLGHKTWHGLAGSSVSAPSQGCSQGVGYALVSSQSWTREGPTSKLTRKVVGQIQFPVYCWTGGLSVLLFSGLGTLSVPCHVGLSIKQLTTCQLVSSV